jgi:hypothetical protein
MAFAALGEAAAYWVAEDSSLLKAAAALGSLQTGVDYGLSKVRESNTSPSSHTISTDNHREYVLHRDRARMAYQRFYKKKNYRDFKRAYLNSRAIRRRAWYNKHRRGSAGKHTQRSSITHGPSKEGVPRNRYRYHDFIVRRMYQMPGGAGGQNVQALQQLIFGESNHSGGFGFNFKLDQMPSYTDFTNMFQFYKILNVEIHFVPFQTCFPALTVSDATNPVKGLSSTTYTPTSEVPIITLAPDDSSSDNFASQTDAFAHGRTTLHSFADGRTFKYRLSPVVKRIAGSTAAPVQASVTRKTWVSTDSPSEAHFGVRGWGKHFYSTTRIDVYVIMTTVFKDLKT